MSDLKPLLAVIPARGGSKGVPGKNIRPLSGLPLIAHSIKMARLCPEIDALVVSTDSDEIRGVAEAYGADVPFSRPEELARDHTPMWPVLRHALNEMERLQGREFGSLMLLDPTSPGRLPEDVAGALTRLKDLPHADGIVGVSRPDFNPIWTCVVERGGFIAEMIPDGGKYTRRQDVPPVYRINGSLYIWRRRLLVEERDNWRRGKILLHEIPEARAVHIDDLHEFERTEALIAARLIQFPWLEGR